jgi:CHAT domain-containing protein
MRSLFSWAFISLFLSTLSVALSAFEPPPNEPPASKQLKEISEQSFQLYSKGQYSEASQVFEQGAHLATSSGDLLRAARFWNGKGGCLHAMGQYRAALAAYRTALELAKRIQDKQLIGILSINISSLYNFLWEPDAAELAVKEGEDALPPDSPYRPQLLYQRSSIRARQHDFEGARKLALAGIDEATRLVNIKMIALGWEKVGWVLLAMGKLPEAESAFTEAFRQSKIQSGPVPEAVYLGLVRVRLAQHRPAEARQLADAALESARASLRIPLWWIYQARGRAYESEGVLDKALADYGEAVRLTKLWRQEMLPAVWMQPAIEFDMSSASSDYIELAARYAPNAAEGARLTQQAFLLTEDTKASSLLRMSGVRLSRKESEQYGETLAQLREALFQSLKKGGDLESPDVLRLRARLSMMEGQAASVVTPQNTAEMAPGARMRVLQQALRPSEALLSFRVGNDHSFLWVLTREEFSQVRLPGKTTLQPEVDSYDRALVSGKPESAKYGSTLAAALLSQLPKYAHKKTDWILSLDEGLFGIPWPALPATGGVKRYLIEDHSIEVVPSAAMLTASRSAAAKEAVAASGRFVAVGDPVYNLADPRFDRTAVRDANGKPWSVVPSAYARGTEGRFLELPRLVGSAKEIESAARSWDPSVSDATLLTGRSANREEIYKSLQGEVAILHFATHVIPSPQSPGSLLVSAELDGPESGRAFSARRPNEIMIALSLDSSGRPDFLTTSDILSSSFRLTNSLVVLNGCSSGKGEVWPGAGLLGLSRAWMTAGARGVVVSHWPTPDDSGAFFQTFYRELSHGSGHVGSPAASALRAAQLGMLSSGSWRSDPRVWAAYFFVGKE